MSKKKKYHQSHHICITLRDFFNLHVAFLMCNVGLSLSNRVLSTKNRSPINSKQSLMELPSGLAKLLVQVNAGGMLMLHSIQFCQFCYLN